MSGLERFQEHLRDLFQLDTADLDFGIYRLFAARREEVDRFIENELPETVDAAFSDLLDAEGKGNAERLHELSVQIVAEAEDDGAILPNGTIKAECAARAGKTLKTLIAEYEELRQKERERSALEEQKDDAYNHLYAFFSRYYDDGDFIPRHFFGARNRYVVPYNGEETLFHWANKDQYYVKSGENFRDYAFQAETVAGPWRIQFKIVEAALPPGNTKGDTRFFFPQIAAIEVDAELRNVSIPFHYRLPTEQEIKRYGPKSKGQAAVLHEAGPAILKAIPDPMLAGVLGEPAYQTEKETQTFLDKRLRHFARKNTTDFFVHKRLREFLLDELEFYIRDQVVHLMDMEADAAALERKRLSVRVFRRLSERIIAFLASIEDAQKTLFEKKKFALSADYLVPIQHVPETLRAEVLANKKQIDQWKDWYSIQPKKDLFNQKGEINHTFLEQHPTLPVDTRCFDPDFKLRLLCALSDHFGDLDEATDGLLIHSENFQALNFLLPRFDGQIDCIHIDPPYNTSTSGFLYKNTYQHSSWLVMMIDRIAIAIQILSRKGAFLCHIDENEYERFYLLLNSIGLPDSGTIVWDKRNPMNAGQGIATQHEYILWRSHRAQPIYQRNDNVLSMLRKAAELIAEAGAVTEEVRKSFSGWVSANGKLTGGEKAYRYIDDEGKIYQSVSLRAPEPRNDAKFHKPLYHPVTKKPCPVPPNGFSRTPETLRRMIDENLILFGLDESTQPRQKVVLTHMTQRQLSSVVQDAKKGKAYTDALGIEFPYCHPVSLYETLLGASVPNYDGAILDYFAGSGTSGHATINLNREDGCQRKFILVEMGDYFNTVLVPRIAKVMYTPEWKEGKPKRMATQEEAERTPRLVKILKLESYEDALHNLTKEEKIKGVTESEETDGMRRISYVLERLMEKSDAMLNWEALDRPFDYTMEVLTDEGVKTAPVDLVETFNALYGLRVQRFEIWRDAETHREYRVIKAARADGGKVLVIWRNVPPEDEAARDRAFLEEHIGDLAQWEEAWVNGPCALPGLKPLDGMFKRLIMGFRN